jgi:predicted ATPase
MEALALAATPMNVSPSTLRSKEAGEFDPVEVTITFKSTVTVRSRWIQQNSSQSRHETLHLIYPTNMTPNDFAVKFEKEFEAITRFQIFAFSAKALASPVRLNSNLVLGRDGTNFAGVLDNLRDNDPERFNALNDEIPHWFPEFDQILFETPHEGTRSIALRTKTGKYKIDASDLSQGVLFGLAYLTLAYLPKPPQIICVEEPEQGVHPRLLFKLQEALYRLAYPGTFNDVREPIQVIATTHSPYLLDLYRDHPEGIVIAQKAASGVQFERLSDKQNVEEFLQAASLGEVWFSGILGGVPAH